LTPPVAKEEIVLALPTLSGRVAAGVAHMLYEAALVTADPSAPWAIRPLWLNKYKPLAYARNVAIETARAMDPRPSRILFVDDDMPPLTNWWRLLLHDSPIVAAETLGWQPAEHQGSQVPATLFPVTFEKNGSGTYDQVMKVGVEEPFICDAAGGVFLVKMEVFDALPLPYFLDERDPVTSRIKITEDVYFYRKANAAGFRVLVDPSVKFDHLKECAVYDVLEYAKEANRQLLKQFRDLRGINIVLPGDPRISH
jgi:hypothetical protein